MTDIRQNFSLVIGDDFDVAFDISGTPVVDLSTANSLTWTAYEQAAPTVPDDTRPVIVKDLPSGGLTIVDPIAMTFTLHLFSADTELLRNANFVHMVVLVDQNGRKTTTTIGLMTVIDECNQPNVISFKTQFPEFESVDDTTVQIALEECAQYIDASWGDQQIPATMFLAAHFLSVSSQGAEAGGQLITSERIGQISVSYAAAAATGQGGSMLTNTVYGRQFYYLLRINSGGIAIV